MAPISLPHKKQEDSISPAKKSFPFPFKKLYRKWRKKKPKVAILRLAGVIGDAGQFRQGLTLQGVEHTIREAFSQSHLKAVAVQINSPGGSPVQSELIHDYLKELSKEKKIPVYTFAEDVAASGGYWLACAGERIYASQNSIIGSIGVIAAGFGFVEAIKKLGIERRVYTQGENKSILDPFQPEKKEDVTFLLATQKEIHESFKELVRQARGDKIKDTDENELFSGRFWTGKKALELGLVDEIKALRPAMKERYGKEVEFVVISKPKSWLRQKLGMASALLVERAFSAMEEKSLWQRFGL